MFRLVLILAIGYLSTGHCDTNYRLNTPIRPSSYSLLITPYFDTKDAKAFTFDAEVKIAFTTENSTSVIKLHSEGLSFETGNITLTAEGENGNIALDAVEPLVFDKKYTFAYINLSSELKAGVGYELKIEYTGPIREDLKGFYRNYYYENGVKKWLGATQMEPTNARKVFPCFDEPHLKAKFSISIIRPGNYEPSLANTEMQHSAELPDGNVLETFYPTPKMSTYLVAFLVSEFKVAANATIESKGFGIYTRPEARNQSDYTLEVGTKIVKALGDYFGIDYYSTDAYLKLDHIALPDFSAGAMENWGLIKYREALLLYVPEVSTPYYKYRVAQIVAHETTHMWFGDLVTCHWWSNTWLNEGFANYFQDYITAKVEPDVGAANALITGSVYAAYDADESAQAPPISNPNVNSPAEINEHFGTITYQKAGSVIRMMHHLLGDEAFKFGLNDYLESNKFSPGYPDRMYESLEKGVSNSSDALSLYPGFDITGVMSAWITQAGHPVVKVNIDYESGLVTLTQKRFYIDPTQNTNELYPIPITFSTELKQDFENTKPAFIMDKETHTFTIADINGTDHPWVLLNNQETGLYRVDYDQHSWAIISKALKGEKREQIHYLNRAKIVNDLFAFYFADEQNFELLYDVLEFLKKETDYSVWLAAIRNMVKLRTKYLGNPALKNIEEYFLDVLEPIIEHLGYAVRQADDFETLRNRMQVLDFACEIGHATCLNNTAELYRNLRNIGIEISPSLRPVAYCSGLRAGNEEDYDFLWQRMKTTNVANEARIIGDALACTSSEDRLKGFLVSMLEEDSPIRTQDVTVPLAGVLDNYDHVHLALEGLRENITLWNTIYGSLDTVLVPVATALHSEEEFVEFESILASCTECSNETLTSARASLALARKSVQWAKDHQTDLLKLLKNAATTNIPAFVVMATVLLTMKIF